MVRFPCQMGIGRQKGTFSPSCLCLRRMRNAAALPKICRCLLENAFRHTPCLDPWNPCGVGGRLAVGSGGCRSRIPVGPAPP
jgi:hypothetical protein